MGGAYHVPKVEYATSALTSQQQSIGSIIAASAFFGYAGWQLIGAVRGRRKSAEMSREKA
ncbi:hypothetical protein CGZ93_12400 [Enemella dayhoffiae]|uniref:Uncharacterized protein n=1 Tax=Enemella dayhoffiae TaxID=2016507 RepID=A0A255GZC6_9ACTN|nr:hypothetical protein CGZ93_12400 [Enemella dayhoffiae]